MPNHDANPEQSSGHDPRKQEQPSGGPTATETTKNQTTAEQRLAMVFLLRYYMTKSRNGSADIAKAAKIPASVVLTKGNEKKDAGRNVQIFIDQFNSPYIEKIRDFLEFEIANSGVFQGAPDLIKDLINEMRGTRARQFGFADEILGPSIEEGDAWKRRMAKVYGSAWFVVRYAAHLGSRFQTLPKDANGDPDPWMVYGLMEIQQEGQMSTSELPAFTVLYHPLQDHETEPPRTIEGRIFSLKEGPYMQFIGYEEGTSYPLIIAANQNKNTNARPRSFRGLVMRKVESGSFVVGNAMFIRTQKSLAQIFAHETLGKVGLFPRSDLMRRLEPEVPDIRTLIEEVRNVANHDGFCMLHL